MENSWTIFIFIAVVGLLLALLGLFLSWRIKQINLSFIDETLDAQQEIAREIRREVQENSRISRQEMSQNLHSFQQAIVHQSSEAIRIQNSQLESFSQQLAVLQRSLSETLSLQLHQVTESNARRLQEMMEVLERHLQQLQSANEIKLDQIRQTVDEKLQNTLQQRLGESFQQVANSLEQVHRGLGEMQNLAQGVGDLKHLLTNVKARGIFGEAQLASLLEQVLTVDQFQAQVSTKPGSTNRVDFAIRLPGKSDYDSTVWLPIDAKFPNEDYERLLEAQEKADVTAATEAGKALEQRIRLEAKSMQEKYIHPPYTTDFAIMFLPSEGLYAEVLRRPGLMTALQRDYHVSLAGPTTLLAMLSSLQMGFRTLAIEKRSSEVWQVLGAVKTEFSKFGDVLSKVKAQTQTVLNTIDSAQVRSRAMDKVLRDVESLPVAQAASLLDLPEPTVVLPTEHPFPY